MDPAAAKSRTAQHHPIVATVLALLVVSSCVGAVAGGANAAEYTGQYYYDGVNIRTGPATSYTSVGLGYYGQELCAYYSVQGESINGNVYWWYHHKLYTNITGYSNSSYLGLYIPKEICDQGA